MRVENDVGKLIYRHKEGKRHRGAQWHNVSPKFWAGQMIQKERSDSKTWPQEPVGPFRADIGRASDLWRKLGPHRKWGSVGGRFKPQPPSEMETIFRNILLFIRKLDVHFLRFPFFSFSFCRALSFFWLGIILVSVRVHSRGKVADCIGKLGEICDKRRVCNNFWHRLLVSIFICLENDSVRVSKYCKLKKYTSFQFESQISRCCFSEWSSYFIFTYTQE